MGNLLIKKGITIVVTGNCGFSSAPVTAEGKKIINDLTGALLDRPLFYEWETMGEFFDYLESNGGLLFNTVQLVGHGALHLAAVQDYTKRPNYREMAMMVSKTAKALDQGAGGLSFGLMYPPGLFSTRGDLLALARVAADRGRIFDGSKPRPVEVFGIISDYPVLRPIAQPESTGWESRSGARSNRAILPIL